MLTLRLNRWSLLIGLIVIVGLSAAAYFFSPKGENQTYVSSQSIKILSTFPRTGRYLAYHEQSNRHPRYKRKPQVERNKLTGINRVWRSTLILSFASCYIMWGESPSAAYTTSLMWTNNMVAITFMAQWHPLIEPKMSKLRKGYPGGS